MSLLQNSNAVTPSAGYDIDNSLRFNAGDAPSLFRDITSTTTSSNFTFSCWFKSTGDNSGPDASTQDCYRMMYSSGNTDVNTQIGLASQSGVTNTPDLCIRFGDIERPSGSMYFKGLSNNLIRDFSAWYHLVLSYDQSLSAASRVRLYLNGELLTLYSQTDPTSNRRWVYDKMYVGRGMGNASGNPERPWDGYMAEVHMLDGITKVASDFGETDEDTGQWKAIKYAGSYGTDGFYLDFSNSAALGTDASGNGNDFTVTNLAATDQMIDTPQNSTGGNFCTLNPLLKWYGSQTYSEGNLKINNTSGYNANVSTIGESSGKWYFEFKAGNASQSIGVIGNKTVGWWDGSAQYPQDASGVFVYYGNGRVNIDGTYVNTLTAFVQDDIIGTALNLDDSEITFYLNGVVQNSGTPIALSGDITNSSVFNFGMVTYVASVATPAWVNFGSDSSFAGTETAQGNTDGNANGDFYYTPPLGYLALCTNNLADPAIALPGEHFNTVLWTGNATARSITGVGFEPDWVWIKTRQTAEYHNLFDVLRGVQEPLFSNVSNAQTTNVNTLTSFDSDGFSIGNDDAVNENTEGIVAWNWKAGGAPTAPNTETTGVMTSGSVFQNGASNTSFTPGSTIYPTKISANTTAGFSIVTYTGTGSNATVAHGLPTAPELILAKNTYGAASWPVGATPVGWTYWLNLNNTNAAASSPSQSWNDTAPSASVFSIGTLDNINASTQTYVAYCFASIEGYSKIGVYEGNGDADGPVLYTGFRPAYILLKTIDDVNSWLIMDNKQIYSDYTTVGNYNPVKADIKASGTGDGNAYDTDFLSNGFKIRNAYGGQNQNAITYFFLAFAESPFKTANAR